jgi:hypothetical protein
VCAAFQIFEDFFDTFVTGAQWQTQGLWMNNKRSAIIFAGNPETYSQERIDGRPKRGPGTEHLPAEEFGDVFIENDRNSQCLMILPSIRSVNAHRQNKGCGIRTVFGATKGGDLRFHLQAYLNS